MSIVQAKDAVSFTTKFPLLPFAIRHEFANKPLFQLTSIVDLVKKLPRDRIEYNSGKVSVSQDPNSVPLVDLDPEEVVRRIETANA